MKKFSNEPFLHGKVDLWKNLKKVEKTARGNGEIFRGKLPRFEGFCNGRRNGDAEGDELALAIVKKITDNMKESICAHSEEGSGNRVGFAVSLA